MFLYLTGVSINLKQNLIKYVWKSPRISLKGIAFKKSPKRLKYYIRKYALNAKESSKGGKGQQKDMRHMENKK